ncbi:MAG TPA: methyltransferase regulatory domain-containing protein, partial [Burkholderiales bacterium]|nr:methyltransferase regulatory domain-containing protein [Burkholderiales bacterium]
MAEQSWGEGYVVDLDYTHGYYRELAPAHLAFVTLLAGLRPAESEPGFTYYELGCGHGHSTALHACTNPTGQFIGIDFNPSHVQSAQRLAREAGIGNVRFLEKSFAEALEMDLPDAEVIALHGVWTWIGDEHRRQIVEFIRRRLKPGGIAYLSYNTLPGLAQVAPLQRLLAEHAAQLPGDRMEQVGRALDFAERLEKTGALYFAASPVARARLGGARRLDQHYVAHEYFNANWSLQYHLDVARALAPAKLGYAASAALVDNFEQFALKPEAAKLVAEIRDRSLAETVKDFVRNQVFRKDVFTRGAPAAAAGELEAMLGRTRFALARPLARCALTGATPAGEVTLKEEAHRPVLRALARSPMTFDELAAAPEAQGLGRVRLRQALFGMAALGNVLPALPRAGEEARRAAAGRFNLAALSRPMPGPADTLLASPVLGAGVPVHFIDRIFLGSPRNEQAAADNAWATMKSRGLRVRRGDQVVDDEN